jgi:hypothetical protein
MLRTSTAGFLAVLLAAGAPIAAAQEKSAPAGPQAIPIHESVTSTLSRYEIVRRLWTESWRAPFAVPGYETREEAEAAFREHAASLGGNGVINFGCYRMPGVFGTGSRFACNGTIVRFL